MVISKAQNVAQPIDSSPPPGIAAITPTQQPTNTSGNASQNNQPPQQK